MSISFASKAVTGTILTLTACLVLRTAWTQKTYSPRVLPLKSPRIVVQKAQRKLLLFSGERLVRAYRVGLGQNPIQDKVREGDRCTPEGDFHITAKNAKSQFYLSLAVSYPSVEHAKRGLRSGLITRRQYDAIMQAIREHRTPPQTTPLGGKILIHAGGSATDWTWGCVALDNSEMVELFDAVPVGTPVRIEH